jgi:voltage-gated potassium channel
MTAKKSAAVRKNASEKIKHERSQLLAHVTGLTDKFMIGLAFVWIGLMIADFIGRLSFPLQVLNYGIWFVFILDFAVKFFIAPHKRLFLRTHWITILSLILPAFRLIRIFQALAALRTLSLLRILTSFNRGMGALGEAMGRRGVGYVIVLTLIVLFAGAAGMYQFESPRQLAAQGYGQIADAGGGLASYSDAVWWTAMLMTTIGSQYWPVTAAGRALCFLISLFSLGVFGYITATLASFFVDSGQGSAPAESDAEKLRKEITALRRELRRDSGALEAASAARQ